MTDQPDAVQTADEAQPILETADASNQNQQEATDDATQEAQSNESEAGKQEPKEDLWPKKAINALSRKDKMLGKARAELAAERQRIAELEEKLKGYSTQKPSENNPPQPGSFQTYEEYIDALTEYKVGQRLSEREQKSLEQKKQTEEKSRLSEREAYINENADKAKEAFSDFENVMQSNQGDLAAIAPHVRKAFLEAENGAYALYALAKEGMLDTLNDMPEHKVIATIARMEDKALAMSQKKPVTKAPAPMTAAKGTASSQKRPAEMSGEELRRWINS